MLGNPAADFPVELDVPVNPRHLAEDVDGTSSGCGSESCAEVRIFQHYLDFLRNVFGTTSVAQKTAYSVLDDFRTWTVFHEQSGFADGHRLKRRDAECLSTRRVAADGGPAQPIDEFSRAIHMTSEQNARTMLLANRLKKHPLQFVSLAQIGSQSSKHNKVRILRLLEYACHRRHQLLDSLSAEQRICEHNQSTLFLFVSRREKVRVNGARDDLGRTIAHRHQSTSPIQNKLRHASIGICAAHSAFLQPMLKLISFAALFPVEEHIAPMQSHQHLRSSGQEPARQPPLVVRRLDEIEWSETADSPGQLHSIEQAAGSMPPMGRHGFDMDNMHPVFSRLLGVLTQADHGDFVAGGTQSSGQIVGERANATMFAGRVFGANQADSHAGLSLSAKPEGTALPSRKSPVPVAGAPVGRPRSRGKSVFANAADVLPG